MYGLPQSAVGVAYLGILLTIVCVLAIPAIIIAILYFRHRERMAYMARPPYMPPQDPASTQPDPQSSPGAYADPDPYRERRYRDRYHPSFYHPLARAGRLIGVGFGITIGLLPLGLQPLLLAGLIPLFVGLIRLGELFLGPPIVPPTTQDLDIWLHRSLWNGGIGLALMLGLWTLGTTPLLLFGSIPLGYALGLLLAYDLARRVR